jgi:hypothetical protein
MLVKCHQTHKFTAFYLNAQLFTNFTTINFNFYSFTAAKAEKIIAFTAVNLLTFMAVKLANGYKFVK